MCSGKNQAQKILSRYGFAVLDTDETAHQALEYVQDRVIKEFSSEATAKGKPLTNPDGSINRRALGELVFSDPALLARHEAIIYPKINELIALYIEENNSSGVVINAPLLHKAAVFHSCTFVIFVSAPLIFRFIRALRRDSLPILQIFRRFFVQKHLFAQYIGKNVDIVRVDNRGSIRAFERKLANLLSHRGY